ncbi:hypothetical protein [Anaerobiospirillum succiniciproducens]|uniref:hypothetical protein n=1 Tax=Anaerobiospirillum succiniciproducens TaxID=13335 RepID=UPI00248EB69B|nr:hypothetical protein [Anaerobiospirillum succiniciproducens]
MNLLLIAFRQETSQRHNAYVVITLHTTMHSYISSHAQLKVALVRENLINSAYENKINQQSYEAKQLTKLA